jgi:hypothetical protein
MKVIPKSTISSWNDKNQVDKMKHSYNLRKEVNPERDLSKIKNPRRLPQPKAPKINMKSIREALGSQPLPMATDYCEYKQSLKNCSGNIIAQSIGDETGTLREKITNSKDIQDILANQLFSIPAVSNEWIVLGLTLAGKVLESKCGV